MGHKSRIDFMIVSSDIKSLVMNVQVKRGAELSTDHHLVIGALKLNERIPTRSRPSRFELIKWEESRSYKIRVGLTNYVINIFQSLPAVEFEVEAE